MSLPLLSRGERKDRPAECELQLCVSRRNTQPVNCLKRSERSVTFLGGAKSESSCSTAVAQWEFSSKLTVVKRLGAKRLVRKSFAEAFQSTMSMCSPWSSATISLMMAPRGPTQLPTASVAESAEDTARMVRLPGSRTIPRTTTTPDLIPGTRFSKSLRTSCASGESVFMVRF